ncbi:PREDICTED: synaptogyrin-2 [Elephantulus edwardii]|uniref:synaptogyrin-2 n=1 Tax=Elephantulus edwardii TaxID=28737 RepID=UPI0003F0D9FB|nr:PREDICTED: synaptogyrin-2 [Elephantulus edwardii]
MGLGQDYALGTPLAGLMPPKYFSKVYEAELHRLCPSVNGLRARGSSQRGSPGDFLEEEAEGRAKGVGPGPSGFPGVEDSGPGWGGQEAAHLQGWTPLPTAGPWPPPRVLSPHPGPPPPRRVSRRRRGDTVTVLVLALIVFACIFGEGYSNTHESKQRYCVFNHNEDACRYGGAIGVLAFLACAAFFVVDAYFPQISNATDRKYLVVGDLLFSALWTFLWFVGFCFLTNQWAATNPQDVLVGADSARAAITFSFFSIFSWGALASLAYQRYKAGVDFIQNYVDPTPDPSTAYAAYPGTSVDTYQQPPFTQSPENTEGYQPPPVY